MAEVLEDETTPRDRQPDQLAQQPHRHLRPEASAVGGLVEEDSVAVEVAAAASEAALAAEEIVASEVADLEVTEVGMEDEAALATSRTASAAQEHHRTAHPLALVEEAEVEGSQEATEAVRLTPTAADTVDAPTTTEAVSVTADRAAATANLSASGDHETATLAETGTEAIEVAGIGTATERVVVGMAEMTIPGSAHTMATTTTIPEANADTERLDSAEQRMGLSQWVFSVLSDFNFLPFRHQG
ncbi:hypothetical protein BU16DRAFT_160830 [Lophium mytilinum]|uniref:Uncharacterized protein n=1 Tax=Lophium mytilinum TaxID=390894 RepID=A0A6A6QDS3_9PEZI|nr:hypothetical protein BU16DRAFT_160830 [Lophium mytilinum]